MVVMVLLVGCSGSEAGTSSTQTPPSTTTSTSSTAVADSTTTTTKVRSLRDFVVHEFEVYTQTGDQAVRYADPGTRLELALAGTPFATTEMTLRNIATSEVVAEASPSQIPDISALMYQTTSTAGLLVEGANPADLDRSLELFIYGGEGLHRVLFPGDYPFFKAEIRSDLEIVLSVAREGNLTLWLADRGNVKVTVQEEDGGRIYARTELSSRFQREELPLPPGDHLLTFDEVEGADRIHLYASFLPEEGAYDALHCTPLEVGTEQIDFLPQWRPGQIIQVGRSESQEDSGSEIGISSTPVEIEVLEASTDGFVLAWEMGDTAVDYAALALPDGTWEELLELSEIRMVYEAGPSGEYLGILNLDEVKDKMEQLIDFLVEAGGIGPEEVEQFREIALSDEAIQVTAAQDLILYHSLYGLRIDATTTEVWDTSLPNVFGGEPFPATQTTEVITPQDPNGCVLVTVTVEPEEAEFMEILFETLAALGPTPSPEELAEMESFHIVNRLEFIYDPGTGQINRATRSLEISTPDHHQSEIVSLVTR